MEQQSVIDLVERSRLYRQPNYVPHFCRNLLIMSNELYRCVVKGIDSGNLHKHMDVVNVPYDNFLMHFEFFFRFVDNVNIFTLFPDIGSTNKCMEPANEDIAAILAGWPRYISRMEYLVVEDLMMALDSMKLNDVNLLEDRKEYRRMIREKYIHMYPNVDWSEYEWHGALIDSLWADRLSNLLTLILNELVAIIIVGVALPRYLLHVREGQPLKIILARAGAAFLKSSSYDITKLYLEEYFKTWYTFSDNPITPRNYNRRYSESTMGDPAAGESAISMFLPHMSSNPKYGLRDDTEVEEQQIAGSTCKKISTQAEVVGVAYDTEWA